MLAKVCNCAVVGLEEVLIKVEVDISRGLLLMAIVGLPDIAVVQHYPLIVLLASLKYGIVVNPNKKASRLKLT